LQIVLVLKSLQIYETSRLGVSIQIFSHVLAYTNSFINPILYNCFSENFRKAFRKVSVFIAFFPCHKATFLFTKHYLIFLLFVYNSVIYFRRILLVLFSCHFHGHTLTMKRKNTLFYYNVSFFCVKLFTHICRRNVSNFIIFTSLYIHNHEIVYIWFGIFNCSPLFTK